VGTCGFVVFTAAPGLGLPPELPGMPVANWRRADLVDSHGYCNSRWALLTGLPFSSMGCGTWPRSHRLPHLIGAPLRRSLTARCRLHCRTGSSW